VIIAGLLLLGFLIGAFGTLIGAGGGFLLAPLLLLLYPREAPATLTAISLTVVLFNAGSGTLAYVRMGRVDLRAGLWFSLATLPGAVLGALTTQRIDHRVFDPLLGGTLVLGSGLLFLDVSRSGAAPAGGGASTRLPAWGLVRHTLTEPGGARREYVFSLPAGIAFSVVVGYLSSLLGIGGGILHVPILVQVLGFPVHIATATSHFVLAVMSLAGVLTHVAMGGYSRALDRALPIGVGALLGAQLGARISSRVRGPWILRSLASGLLLVGLRLLMTLRF
jgi:uncharacterized membrane protein YfcA